MSEQEKAPPGIDPRTPSVARMYDYYLGGKDNFASDRESAERIIKIFPQAKEVARENRAFLGRAVRLLAELGIRQFIDIGTGLPTRENVHQVALETAPGSRVVYVDNDPIVLVHARALLADNPRTIVIDGDLRDPKAIMEHPEVRAHIDVDEPYAVILCAIVHFVEDDDEATGIVSYLRDDIPPGGALVLSHGFHGDLGDSTMAEAREVYARTKGTLKLRDRTKIGEYFSGLDLVEPGLVHVQAWRPEYPVTVDPGASGGLGGVGLVPRRP
ncbi:SAM-dependent methyltransferase [Sphaerisporangium sp. TRM90804]|uniref:SAM-dependent methyltransferase n=1 Tax=Sphaerisporangium sp. TRM90804 TaxID=3031113 RepID=UPI002449EC94|nr:SAM-dependent methyltransferase [Sphaerisporangium sp. TRM90804]MDH2425224.1 SAM-dependent methyltransferase [Sphaerisporangium sp. TRM90804]